MSVYKYGRSVPEFIKRYRQDFDLSQEDLAKRLGLKSGQYVSNVERGVDPCPVGLCKRMMKLLDKDRARWMTEILVEHRSELLSKKLIGKNKRLK